jgi:hypothetical protein
MTQWLIDILQLVEEKIGRKDKIYFTLLYFDKKSTLY